MKSIYSLLFLVLTLCWIWIACYIPHAYGFQILNVWYGFPYIVTSTVIGVSFLAVAFYFIGEGI